MEFIVKDPFSQNIIKTYPAFSEDRIASLLKNASLGFKDWKDLSLSKRGQFLLVVKNKMQEHREELARAITLEIGKRISESLAEVDKCLGLIDHYVQKSEDYLKPLNIAADGTKHEVRFEPLGVILSIMPWNFPLWQALRFAIPSLMAGNVVLLKPAPESVLSSDLLAQIFAESWEELKIGQHIFQLCLAQVSQLEKLIENPIVRAVSFTGSTKAGKKVAAIAGAHMKKAVLELGGSDPFLVLEGCNLQKIFPRAAEARLVNCGQTCIAAKRFIIHQSLLADFILRLENHFKAYIPGNPMETSTTLAPLFHTRGVVTLQELVDDALKKGATLIMGGKPLGDKGQFYAPTILTGINSSMRVYREEAFGPLALIFGYDTLEEGIRICNDTHFGLGASVWGENAELCQEAAIKIECGSVFINATVKSDPRVPFGGVKESGLGRELGPLGILEFTNPKSYNYYDLR